MKPLAVRIREQRITWLERHARKLEASMAQHPEALHPMIAREAMQMRAKAYMLRTGLR